MRQIVRETINEMVKDIISNTKKNIILYKIRTLKDVYESKSQIVCFSKKMNIFDMSIKYFLKERMYYNEKVLKKTNKGKKIIKFLFMQIKKNPKKYIKLKNTSIKNTERVVCDFIAGMTDRFAINLYNQFK